MLSRLTAIASKKAARTARLFAALRVRAGLATAREYFACRSVGHDSER